MVIKTQPKPQQAIIIEEDQSFDVIIVGGGPAGLTAALYALRSKLNTLLVEKMILGGLATTTYKIDNYPGFPDGITGQELGQRLENQVKKLSPTIVWGKAVQVKNGKRSREVIVDGKSYFGKTVVIATGSDPAKLGIPGEETFTGRGVSYCAVCDGAFYQDKSVVVVGGGNSAVEEALFLTRYAGKVSIIHRRDKLRADRIVAEKAQSHPKIYFHWNSTAEEIIGDKNVNGIVVRDLLSKKKLTVPTDGVFVYIGYHPNIEAVKGMVKLDERGFIITDENMKTSAPGIFAAGDVRAKSLRQVVTATADGAIAANSAREFIEKGK
ncbi:thioredoxin-disulfide reductase [candidate division WOR-1 bacterium RIFOXYA12_FULL_52_29]|uniref:Thioredoxin reductase n=1 Tax=candidate division WOR-1 bacterium RIFOXYC12_FULL_54_18 TaxID=1802584 RepID=A0A1F4T7Q8_UNCSA|nr:MAG: thioredoxin-disulfide reductase [candidate division WOR-1 bacterium RIFOXYA2_FULL_51_19]OGC18331.1 MAG: thioredoxin-disulfide reductase [candidate division WOR-1 bacterium RIFOXYA12_FULL_52_29]OGC27186.1 MAG: thioredoxin-disulfide reductase [candidate division WOR-1 bacterium RIFOXYB2_FULL_45_9]OGC28748.1 MAG: thioredoxin-disulfide reductase [candidate division WOR-1 bacterium RIFOXYC12_FULL_54_18]OGC30797.1 MAG: thioredoxin-disulfide reductase [candidate division WOR-1 bacterium RIFOXY